jgi:hypothetical protein
MGTRQMNQAEAVLRREVDIDAAFQAFPPLGSSQYLAHIESAATADLPPESLARAFRQLPPESDAARATLERLFRKRGTRWDYLGPLVRYARSHSDSAKPGDYKDLLQDALARILQVLPTSRGEQAERFWHSYCRRELSEAWRARYGRRGERISPERPVECGECENPDEVLDTILTVPPPWHAIAEAPQIERIEAIAREVVEQIGDEFIRAVARASWFTNEPPSVSGSRRTAEGEPPLTTLFTSKSRHQITRARRHANAQLAAALLTAKDLLWEPNISALLERLGASDQAAHTQESEQ